MFYVSQKHLLISVQLPRSRAIIVALFVLYLLAKSSTAECDVYDGQVLSEDYKFRDTSGNFFQSYCAPLLCNGKNADTHMRSLRYTYVATFREQHIFVYLRILICCIKTQTEADFKLNTVKKH